uniref:TldD/PmbA family protein n=1 Tax=Strongyloides papillosus TaxID=174720 RepID=A0A0N5CH29_STREA
MKLTEDVTRILSNLDAEISRSEREESQNSLLPFSITSKLKSYGIYSGRLYEGDIILTRSNARELIDEAIEEAKKKNVDISKFDTEIKNLGISGNLN